MISMVVYLGLGFNCLIVFLSVCESFFPTIIRQESRSSVGVFPLKICPSGFCWFKIVTVCLHHHRVVDYDVNVSKSIKVFQSQIWDPGASNSRFEDGEITLRIYCVNTSRLMFSSVVEISDFSLLMESTLSSHGLLEFTMCHHSGSVLPSLKCIHTNGVVRCDLKLCHTLLFRDGAFQITDLGLVKTGDITTSRARLYIRGYAIVEMFSGKTAWGYKERSNFMSLLLRIDVGDKHPLIPEVWSEQGKYFLSQCFVKDPKKRWLAAMLLHDPFVAIDRAHGESEEDFVILPKTVWQQQQFKRRQERPPHEYRESLLESSSILISTKRQKSESSQTTLNLYFLIKVMPKAFWSLSSKLITSVACKTTKG